MINWFQSVEDDLMQKPSEVFHLNRKYVRVNRICSKPIIVDKVGRDTFYCFFILMNYPANKCTIT